MDGLSIDIRSLVIEQNAVTDEKSLAVAIAAQAGQSLDPETLAVVSAAVQNSIRNTARPPAPAGGDPGASVAAGE